MIAQLKRLSDKHFPLFGIAASVFMLVGLLVPQIGFENQEGEIYSFLNHFISELGWLGVSDGAVIFNACLILAGFFYALFSYGLIRKFGGWWTKVTMVLALLSSLSCSLVGFFPVQSNWLGLAFHIIAASMIFGFGYLTFISVVAMVLFDTRKVVPRLHLWVYCIVPLYVIPWLGLGYEYRFTPFINFKEVKITHRPDVWIYPVVEWAIIIFMVINLFFVSVYFWIRHKFGQINVINNSIEESSGKV